MLNSDCWLQICGYLSWKELAVISRTCKLFSDDFFQKLAITKNPKLAIQYSFKRWVIILEVVKEIYRDVKEGNFEFQSTLLQKQYEGESKIEHLLREASKFLCVPTLSEEVLDSLDNTEVSFFWTYQQILEDVKNFLRMKRGAPPMNEFVLLGQLMYMIYNVSIRNVKGLQSSKMPQSKTEVTWKVLLAKKPESIAIAIISLENCTITKEEFQIISKKAVELNKAMQMLKQENICFVLTPTEVILQKYEFLQRN